MSCVRWNNENNFNNLVSVKRTENGVLLYRNIDYKPRNPSLLILQKVPATVSVTESVLSNLFPDINFRLHAISTTMPGTEVAKIIDDYVNETGHKDIILDLNSQQLSDYGLEIVRNRPSLTFINMKSSVPQIRGTHNNLYFGIESDDFFLPATFRRFRGPTSVQYMILQSEENLYVQNVESTASIFAPHITVIKENDIQNYQEELSSATTIFICSLTEASQEAITNSIPNSFSGFIVFIDSGPLNENVLTNLENVQLIYTVAPTTSLAFLPGNHPWNLQLSSSYSNTVPPSTLGIYTIINSIQQWKRLLIDSQSILNTTFGVNSRFDQLYTVPT